MLGCVDTGVASAGTIVAFGVAKTRTLRTSKNASL
jgi:hypothetical protein